MLVSTSHKVMFGHVSKDGTSDEKSGPDDSSDLDADGEADLDGFPDLDDTLDVENELNVDDESNVDNESNVDDELDVGDEPNIDDEPEVDIENTSPELDYAGGGPPRSNKPTKRPAKATLASKSLNARLDKVIITFLDSVHELSEETGIRESVLLLHAGLAGRVTREARGSQAWNAFQAQIKAASGDGRYFQCHVVSLRS